MLPLVLPGDMQEAHKTILTALQLFPVSEHDKVRFSIHKKMKAGLGSRGENSWMVRHFLNAVNGKHERGENHKFLPQGLCCSSCSDVG